MPLIYDNSYENIKNRVRPGDVIAFSGDAPISTVIKLVTSSHVSHVGMIVPDDLPRDDDSDEVPLISEATKDGIRTRSLRKRCEDKDVEKLWWLPLDPVFHTRLTENWDTFHQALRDSQGRQYDYLQAGTLGLMLLKPTLDAMNPALYDTIRGYLLGVTDQNSDSNVQPALNFTRQLLHGIGSGILHGLLDTPAENPSRLIANEEDFRHFFCSEFVTGVLEVSGVIPGINASVVTPIDLCRFNLYEEKYTQFKGEEATRIRGFNCVDTSRWEG